MGIILMCTVLCFCKPDTSYVNNMHLRLNTSLQPFFGHNKPPISHFTSLNIHQGRGSCKLFTKTELDVSINVKIFIRGVSFFSSVVISVAKLTGPDNKRAIIPISHVSNINNKPSIIIMILYRHHRTKALLPCWGLFPASRELCHGHDKGVEEKSRDQRRLCISQAARITRQG